MHNYTDYFIDASVGWAINENQTHTLNEMLCENCGSVGFGYAKNKKTLFIVAIYDKKTNKMSQI